MSGADAQARPPALRVLVAPDSYGDSMTAVQAAAVIVTGWQRARPCDRCISVPQSDGGPGFVDVLSARLGVRRRLRVAGPLDVDVPTIQAEWLFDPESADHPATAYLECAQACGLHLLGGPPSPQSAVAAHSRGVGQLLVAAVAAGARRIVVGLGGSASTDGGRGLVDELGGLPAARRRLAGLELIAASDVDHPLLGPHGAARVFGPQKGADAATELLLERRLQAWGRDLDQAAGRAVSAKPGSGAAGGIGAALFALGARRESGAAIIAEHTGLIGDVAAADLIVSGEGRLDDQSLRGKVIGALAAAARPRRVPLLVLAGQVCLDEAVLRAAGIDVAYSLADHAGSVRSALAEPARHLTDLATRAAATFGE